MGYRAALEHGDVVSSAPQLDGGGESEYACADDRGPHGQRGLFQTRSRHVSPHTHGHERATGARVSTLRYAARTTFRSAMASSADMAGSRSSRMLARNSMSIAEEPPRPPTGSKRPPSSDWRSMASPRGSKTSVPSVPATTTSTLGRVVRVALENVIVPMAPPAR